MNVRCVRILYMYNLHCRVEAVSPFWREHPAGSLGQDEAYREEPVKNFSIDFALNLLNIVLLNLLAVPISVHRYCVFTVCSLRINCDVMLINKLERKLEKQIKVCTQMMLALYTDYTVSCI